MCLITKPIRLSTKDAILDAGFQLLSRDPGASLAQVAEMAGVGRATLHRYFASRETLVGALAQAAIEEMDSVVEAACADVNSYGEALRATLEALIPLADRYGFLALEAVDHDPALQDGFQRQRRETQAAIVAATEEGVFDPAIPTDWIVQAYEHLLFAGWESVKAGEATPKQAAALAWRTLTSGLGRTDT